MVQFVPFCIINFVPYKELHICSVFSRSITYKLPKKISFKLWVTGQCSCEVVYEIFPTLRSPVQNPIEVLTFSGLYTQLLKLRL